MTIKEFFRLFSDSGELSQEEFDELKYKYKNLSSEGYSGLIKNITQKCNLNDTIKFNSIHYMIMKYNIPIKYYDSIDRVLKGYKLEISDRCVDVSPENYQIEPDMDICIFFGEAIVHLGFDRALAFFEERKDFEHTIKRIAVSNILKNRNYPLFTLKELCVHTRNFLSIVENQYEFLISCGHPKQIYSSTYFLSSLLPCYYTRFPNRIYHDDPHFLDNEITFDKQNYMSREYPADIINLIHWSKNATLTYDWPDGNLRHAPLIKGIALNDELFILGIRPKIQSLKKEILRLIIETIEKQSAINLWKEAFQIIKIYLTWDELEKLIAIDTLYGNVVRLDFSGKWISGIMPSGGISEILKIIGFFELEISTRKYHRLKTYIDYISNNTKITSYFQVIGQKWKVEFDGEIDHFIDSTYNKEKVLWDMYLHRVKRDFLDSYDYNLQVSPKHFNLINDINELLRVGEPHGTQTMSKKLKKILSFGLQPKKTYRAKFGTVETKSFNWDDIELLFKDSHNIRIKIKGESQQFDYGEMGFKDGNTGKPHKSWSLLEGAANNEGLIGIDVHAGKVNPGPSKYKIEELENGFEKASLKLPGKEKKQKQILSDQLKAFFELDTDPFHPYQKNLGWRARFKISQ